MSTKKMLLIGFLSLSVAAKAQIKLSGYVQDSSTSEKIINAYITRSDNNEVHFANNYGFFNLYSALDTLYITVKASGYESEKILVTAATNSPITVNLSKFNTIKKVVITGKSGEAPVNSSQMSAVTIPIDQIKLLPRFFGETDILKAIQLMPGISGGSEGSTGLYVRGGGPDQNLMLLDGTPLYNVNHLFGFFSVFNTDAINSVSVLKGGFPARYGGRLSSIVDVTMKDGNKQKYNVEGSLGMLASKLMIEGPIIKNKASFIISGRRTYLDALLNPLLSATQGAGVNVRQGYFFYDLNGKVNYTINKKNQLYLSYYGGLDKFYRTAKPYSYLFDGNVFETSSSEGQQWGNQLLALKWNKILDNNSFIKTQLSYTQYNFNVFNSYKNAESTDTSASQTENRFNFTSGIKDISLKSDLEKSINRHDIKMGAQLIYHRFVPGSNNLFFAKTGEPTIDTIYGEKEVGSIEMAVYAEDDYEINNKWKINYGLHFNFYNYGKKSYFSPQPRLAARYLISPSLSFKSSYSRMRQNIHLLTNNTLGLPTDLWVPATDIVRPMTADQIAIGLTKNLSKMFEFTLEGYYKQMRDIIEYREGASYFSQINGWENKVLAGNGRAYGVEALIQKRLGALTGWLGYTLSYSTRNIPGINNNKTFYYKYDSRHDLSFVLNYKDGEKYDYGLVWVFRTGNAITLPTSAYPPAYSDLFFSSQNQAVFGYSERNNFRFANYHRLDLSFTKHYIKKWGLIDLNASLYNTYSRINPFYYKIDIDNQGNRQIIRVGLFPILPSVSVSFKF